MTITDRNRIAMGCFPYQITIKSDDGSYSSHGGYTSKQKAIRKARDILRFDPYNKRPIRSFVHDALTGAIVHSKGK